MLPNYLIIGTARGGTTWLAKNLMLHPEIFMHNRKELHFFERDYDKGIDWYEEKFNNVNESIKVVGEGTPAYLYNEHVSELIKEHMPNVKLIVSLRDPVERAYSHYQYRERERQSENQPLSFEQKIEATPSLIETGLYARKLQKYYDLFPKENILIILYDELKKDPEQYLKRVYKFLGVNTEFRSPLIKNKINAASSKAGKFHALYWLDRIFVKTGLFKIAKLVNNLNKKTKVESVSTKTREMLLERYFLEDIEKLEEMIQMDLSEWKKIQPA